MQAVPASSKAASQDNLIAQSTCLRCRRRPRGHTGAQEWDMAASVSPTGASSSHAIALSVFTSMKITNDRSRPARRQLYMWSIGVDPESAAIDRDTGPRLQFLRSLQSTHDGALQKRECPSSIMSASLSRRKPFWQALQIPARPMGRCGSSVPYFVSARQQGTWGHRPVSSDHADSSRLKVSEADAGAVFRPSMVSVPPCCRCLATS